MKKILLFAAASVLLFGCTDSKNGEVPQKPLSPAENRVARICASTLGEADSDYEIRFTYDAQQRVSQIYFDGMETTLTYGNGTIVAESFFEDKKQTSRFEMQNNRITGASWMTGDMDVRATFDYSGETLVRFESEWKEVATGDVYSRTQADAVWKEGCLVAWNSLSEPEEMEFRASSCPNDSNIDFSVLLAEDYMGFEEITSVAMLRLFGTPSRYIMENVDTDRYTYQYTYRKDERGRLVGGTIEVTDLENPQESYTDTYTVEYVVQ